MRDAFEQRYAANSAVLTAQVRAVVAAFDSGAAEPGAPDAGAAAGPGGAAELHRWVAAIDPLGTR